MIGFESFATLFGGIGMFVLGMSLMTDGLKQAAGPALHRILAASTRTRWHALGSGMLVTALVQSSTAVTVAAIGFVNAALLGLGQALWVLFGANVGTTMTGWIVALLGLKLKIDALALPLVGAGVVLRIAGEGKRLGALGTATAGFGLLFLGIDMLQASFTGLAGGIQLPQGTDLAAIVMQVGAGILLTLLIQSSSAAMTIALTAAHGGLLTVDSAAAVVIGANIGTTATAIIASIGATANAKRAAVAHVMFNLVTGAVALALLPWLIGALGVIAGQFDLPDDPATKLALFHTIFNVLGVMLMWPLADRLTRWLEHRFASRADDEGRPQHLDSNVLAVPALALDALQQETARIARLALALARSALNGVPPQALAEIRQAHANLDAAAESFVERMNRSTLSPEVSRRLAAALRVLRYWHATAEQAALAAGLDHTPALAHAGVAQTGAHFRAGALQLLDLMQATERSAGALESASQAMEQDYQALKAALLEAGAAGQITLAGMDSALRHFSALRRALVQALEANAMIVHVRP